MLSNCKLHFPHTHAQARIQKLGADPVVFGYMGTVGAVCVLVGGPAFGLFADKFGPRPSLIAAYFSDTMKYSIVAMGNSIPMLFVSRLFGVASHPRQGQLTYFNKSFCTRL